MIGRVARTGHRGTDQVQPAGPGVSAGSRCWPTSGSASATSSRAPTACCTCSRGAPSSVATRKPARRACCVSSRPSEGAAVRGGCAIRRHGRPAGCRLAAGGTFSIQRSGGPMRSILIVTAAVALCGPGGLAWAAQEAPDGEQVYRQHCARCHEGSMPRMPTREMLRQRTPEDVEIALSTFTHAPPGRGADGARAAGGVGVRHRPPARLLPGPARGHPRARLLRGAGRRRRCRSPARPGTAGARGCGTPASSPAEAAGLTVEDVPRLALQVGVRLPGRHRLRVAGERGRRARLRGQPQRPRLRPRRRHRLHRLDLRGRRRRPVGPVGRCRIPAAARRSSTSATRSPTSTRSTSRAGMRAGRCRWTTTATR